MKPPKKTDTTKTEIPSTADVHQLAEIFGMSTRSIQNLEKQGVVVRTGHGRYDLHLSVKRYIAHLEDGASSEDSEFAIQRTRVYRARAEILEAQSQAIRGELHDAACMTEVVGEGLANMRAKLLALPSRLAPLLADESDPNKCASLIETLLHEAMLECSKYNGREVINRYVKKQGKAPTEGQSNTEELQKT